MKKLCLVLIVSAIVAAGSAFGAEDFQKGFRIISIQVGNQATIYYAKPNGDIYRRTADTIWDGPPTYVGNFFFGQPAPNDFLDGFRAVVVGVGNDPLLIYASATGDIYRQGGTQIGSAPGHDGNFFNGQTVPSDFQAGLRTAVEGTGRLLMYYYADSAGNVYRQPSVPNSPPAYLGLFWAGGPLPTTPSSIGSVKAQYRKK